MYCRLSSVNPFRILCHERKENQSSYGQSKKWEYMISQSSSRSTDHRVMSFFFERRNCSTIVMENQLELKWKGHDNYCTVLHKFINHRRSWRGFCTIMSRVKISHWPFTPYDDNMNYDQLEDSVSLKSSVKCIALSVANHFNELRSIIQIYFTNKINISYKLKLSMTRKTH